MNNAILLMVLVVLMGIGDGIDCYYVTKIIHPQVYMRFKGGNP